MATLRGRHERLANRITGSATRLSDARLGQRSGMSPEALGVPRAQDDHADEDDQGCSVLEWSDPLAAGDRIAREVGPEHGKDEDPSRNTRDDLDAAIRV